LVAVDTQRPEPGEGVLEKGLKDWDGDMAISMIDWIADLLVLG
jgi:hypothetical protein